MIESLCHERVHIPMVVEPMLKRVKTTCARIENKGQGIGIFPRCLYGATPSGNACGSSYQHSGIIKSSRLRMYLAFCGLNGSPQLPGATTPGSHDPWPHLHCINQKCRPLSNHFDRPLSRISLKGRPHLQMDDSRAGHPLLPALE